MAEREDDIDDYAPGTNGSNTSGHKRTRSEDGRPADVPSWYDRTPTGAREAVDTRLAYDLAHRPRQIQNVSPDDFDSRKFSHTQFVAHVHDRISYTRNGDMQITIVVPYQFKHLAEPLTTAFGIPLSFDVEVWAPYPKENQ